MPDVGVEAVEDEASEDVVAEEDEADGDVVAEEEAVEGVEGFLTEAGEDDAEEDAPEARRRSSQ